MTLPQSDPYERRQTAVDTARSLPLPDAIVHLWHHNQFAGVVRIDYHRALPSVGNSDLAAVEGRVGALRSRAFDWADESWAVTRQHLPQAEAAAAYDVFRSNALAEFHAEFPEFSDQSFDLVFERAVFALR
ncbi:hypothetical protein [Amnibacterium kyonggiense]|uniref:hypothetical protein n=1 Tax=Amnibacterium kyonggiense TaxID=595671 RepID=UPI00106143E2|nr:hypothetical protein [Amnibacterium kyonggiense]